MQPYVEGSLRNARLEFAYNLGDEISEIMNTGGRTGRPGSLGHIHSAPGEPLAAFSGLTERSYEVTDYKNKTSVRVGGGIVFWEFAPDGLERPTLLPAIDLAIEKTFG